MDVLILLAGSTSIFQPLDLTIYGIFKRQYRKWNKRGGKYEAVRAASNAFEEAFKHDNIVSAWARSNLLIDNPQNIIEKYDNDDDPITTPHRTVVSNVVVTSNPISNDSYSIMVTLVWW